MYSKFKEGWKFSGEIELVSRKGETITQFQNRVNNQLTLIKSKFALKQALAVCQAVSDSNSEVTLFELQNRQTKKEIAEALGAIQIQIEQNK